MKSSGLNKSWNSLLLLLSSNIKKTVIQSKSKEDILISKLQNKLGKSKNEVKKIISTGLMDVLTKVPFSCK